MKYIILMSVIFLASCKPYEGINTVTPTNIEMQTNEILNKL